MASSARYHILPDATGRPSTDSLSDESQRLIHTQSRFNAANKSKIGFTDLHITLYLRIIAFLFFLAAALVLGLRGESQRYRDRWYNDDHNAVASIVCLAFALARNVFVIFRHLVESVVKVSVRLELSGDGKSRFDLPAVLKGRLLGMVLDATLVVALFTVLPIGLMRNRDWIFPGVKEGFLVAFAGMPWYFFSIIDGGRPRSVALSACLTLNKKKDDEDTEVPPQEYRDIEAQQPEVRGIEEEVAVLV